MSDPSPVDAILAQTPVTRFDDVVVLLSHLRDALPAHDGISCFSALYARVSGAILEGLYQGEFEDPAFLSALGAAFANHYFFALKAWRSADGRVPRAWSPLFEARSRSGIHPLQFALAGMNAHINRDLSVALVDTFSARRRDMRKFGAEHMDYEHVNDILTVVEKQAKLDYFKPLAAQLDRSFDGVEDALTMWAVREARDAAWSNGEALWALRNTSSLRDNYLTTLDGIVGLAGWGLLLPKGPGRRGNVRRSSRAAAG